MLLDVLDGPSYSPHGVHGSTKGYEVHIAFVGKRDTVVPTL